MACFVVPAVEAAVVTVVRKISERKAEEKLSVTTVNPELELAKKDMLLHKSRWLTSLLWGGSVLLAFEHLWHGEITPWFPFLTAMRDPDATSAMLHEMATNGVGMALLVTVAWGGMVLASHILSRRNRSEKEAGYHV